MIVDDNKLIRENGKFYILTFLIEHSNHRLAGVKPGTDSSGALHPHPREACLRLASVYTT